MNFDIQLFADVVTGTSGNNRLSNSDNNTQFYGLAGNDTISSSGRNAILIGGSGNDSLNMLGGNGTLSGGAGNDTFSFNYSTYSSISALIEDINPSEDRLVIHYSGTAPSDWNYRFSGRDLILSDSGNRLNITLKGTMPLDEYYDSEGNNNIWEVLEEVNEEREDAGLAPLTLSQELMNSAAVRSDELLEYYSHTRPDGSDCFTALENNIGYRAENIAAGYSSADDVMDGWMNSSGHRANILGANFAKIGIGYTYDSNSYYQSYWAQMFRSREYSNETLSADELLSTNVMLSGNNSSDRVMTLRQLTADDTIDVSMSNSVYNQTKNTVVNGTSKNDSIENVAGGVIIRAGAGNDFIYNNTTWSHTINGGYGYVTIDGGAGDDSIESHDPNMSINAGAGDDIILMVGSHAGITVRGGSGDDSILSSLGGGTGKIYQYATGDGNDVISGFGTNDTLMLVNNPAYSTIRSDNNVFIQIGTNIIDLHEAFGKTLHIVGGTRSSGSTNFFSNSDDNTVLTGSGNNDMFYNEGEHSTIVGSGGDDTLYNDSLTNYVLLDGGAGNDLLYSKADSFYVTLRGGADNDTIESYGYYNSIIGGSGNDSIQIYDYSTINGGNGNDSIELDGIGNIVEYASGDGNDVILYYSSFDTIRITDGSTYSTTRSGSDTIISVGSGSITLKEAVTGMLNIIGGSLIGGSISSGINHIFNSTMNSLVSGTSNSDSIYNGGDNATISAGDGDDIIDNRGDYASINGGSGNDSIVSNKSTYYGWYVTVRGGIGNDTITGSNHADVFQYANGDGNDIITNFDSTDTIRITDGSTYSTTRSGSDMIVSIGSGSITLKNTSSANIVGGNTTVTPDNDTIENHNLYSVVSGTSGDDTISNYAGGTTINGGEGNDYIYSSTFETINDDYGYVTIDGGDGNDSIYTSDPNVSINGGDGNDIIDSHSWDHVTMRGGLGNDTFGGTGAYRVYQYAIGDGNDIITGFSSTDTLRVTDGSSYSTTRSGSDMLVSIGSGSITLKNTSSANISGGSLEGGSIGSGSFAINYISNAVSSRDVNGTDGRDFITNTGSYVEIDAEDGNDTIDNYAANAEIDGGYGNDSINVHGYSNVTIDGGEGNDTITNLGLRNVIAYESGDGNDVIYGFDSTDTIRITDGSTYSTTRSGSDMLVSIGSGSMTLKNVSTAKISGGSLQGGSVDTTPSSNVISINEDSPYLNNTLSSVSIIGSDDDDSIINIGQYVSIVENEGENTILSSGTRATIRGGEDDDVITNSGANSSINAGDGDDTLVISANSTVTGGDGDDLFRIKTSGTSSSISVTITDLEEADSLAFISTNTTGFTYSIDGGNMTMKDNTGVFNLTLGGITSMSSVSDVEVALRNPYGTLRTTTTLGKIATLASDASSTFDGVTLSKNGKTLKIKNPFSGTIYADDFGDKVKTLNASSNQNEVELIGNELNNVIKASKGGSTIEGGEGKDKITCGKGADLIVYAEDDGKDTIKKFDPTQDKIQIWSGEIDSVKIKSKNVVLNIGDGSLTVQKVVGQELKIIDEDDIESTYVFTKQNNTLEKALISSRELDQLSATSYWFDEEIQSDPLESIMESDAAVDLNFDELSEVFKPKTLELAGSARHERKR